MEFGAVGQTSSCLIFWRHVPILFPGHAKHLNDIPVIQPSLKIEALKNLVLPLYGLGLWVIVYTVTLSKVSICSLLTSFWIAIRVGLDRETKILMWVHSPRIDSRYERVSRSQSLDTDHSIREWHAGNWLHTLILFNERRAYLNRVVYSRRCQKKKQI